MYKIFLDNGCRKMQFAKKLKEDEMKRMQNILSLFFAISVLIGLLLLTLQIHEWLIEQTTPLGATIVFCFITSLLTIIMMAILTGAKND